MNSTTRSPTEENRPLSQIYYEAAQQWADLEAAATLLEDTKSAVMAERQTYLGDIPVNRAEQLVKASPGWKDHINTIVQARREANLAKVKLEYLKMKFQEWSNSEANNRTATRL